jgi:type I restriction enzyme, S subunit
MTFLRYPLYKSVGLPWLQETPQHWTLTKTKHVVQFTTGWTPPTGDSAAYEGENLWANISDLGPKTIVDTSKRISDEAIKVARIKASPKGSLLFSFKLSVGQVSFAGQDMYTNEAIATFLPSPKISLSFAYYAFPVFLIQNAAENIYGAKLLNQSLIESASLPLPTLDEQLEIAAFLDREILKIDELSAAFQNLIDLLKEKRQAIIAHAVTKGLDSSIQMKDSGTKWLGQVPAHWGICQSRRMFAVRSEAALASDRMLTASQKYGVLFQSDFVELEGRRVVEVIMGVESLKHVEPDDFIISMRSFQGGLEWCKLRGSTSFHYVMIRAIKDVHPPFFAHLFKSIVYIQALRATTDLIRDGQELRYSNFVMVDLPVVPMEEQKRIANFIDGELFKIDNLLKDSVAAIELLKERREVMITAAVTGKIDVRGLVNLAEEQKVMEPA